MRENPDAAQFQGTATGPDPLPPEHAFYALIGRVIAEWARFEHILDTLIWDLSAVEAVKGSCITGRLAGAGQRCHTIKALCTAHALSKDTLDQVRTLNKDQNGLVETRNRVTHDAWFDSKGTVSQFRSWATKDFMHGFQPITDADLTKTISEIKTLQIQAENLATRVRSELSALRAKGQQQG